MSDDLFFVDTNVFVYSFNGEAPDKRTAARDLIRMALESGRGVISSQVIQEFLNVALRKFRQPLDVGQARRYMDSVLLPLCRIYPGRQYFTKGLELKEETGYSLYDCLILAGALEAGCSILYSEDMQHGRQVRSLRIVNPFEDSEKH